MQNINLELFNPLFLFNLRVNDTQVRYRNLPSNKFDIGLNICRKIMKEIEYGFL